MLRLTLLRKVTPNNDIFASNSLFSKQLQVNAKHKGNSNYATLNAVGQVKSTEHLRYRTEICAIRSATSSAATGAILNSAFSDVQIPDMSLSEYVWKDVNEWSTKPAVTCGVTGRSYSFGEARAHSNRLACALRSTLGLQKGSVIALLLPNMPEYIMAIHGSIEAGLVVTVVNPLYTPGEIGRQFANANVKCVITIPQLIPVMEQVGPKLSGFTSTIIVGIEKHDELKKIFSYNQLVAEAQVVQLPSNDPNDIALLPYSSGTTGLPKGVKLSHRNLVANLEQMKHPDIVHHTPTSDTFQERSLSVLPFFHIFGFNGILNPGLIHGIHMITIPKFTPDDYIACIVQYKPTILFLVPSLLLFLASHPAVTKEHLSSLSKVVCGAAPAPKNLIDKFKGKLGRDGVNIRQGYGMTESAPVTLFTRRVLPNSKIGSCGQLLPLTQARVVDLITNENQGPHQTGELLIKGPQVMVGYLDNEKATRETVDSEGWLHTGDVAYYDDEEYFFIVDRTKELIKVKGNQVSPTELENIVIQMPDVADVAVVGIPDEKAGEIPRAFVVRHPGAHVTERQVLAFVEPKVISYKKLAGGVIFLDAIPRNPAGKVLRNELKALRMEVMSTIKESK